MKLSNVLDRSARVYGNFPCVVWQEEEEEDQAYILTYRSALETLAEHRLWLLQQLDTSLLKGSDTRRFVVAYLSNNSVDLFLSVLASTDDRIPVTTALLNTRWTPTEIASALDSKDSNNETLLLYGPGLEEMAQAAVKRLHHRAKCLPIPELAHRSKLAASSYHFSLPKSSSFNHRTEQEIEQEILQMTLSDDEMSHDALIVFTSGTTSGSKGVRLSHRAVYLQAMAKLASPCRYTIHTAMLASTVPFFHVGGLSSILAVWLAGGRLVLPMHRSSVAGFDPLVVERSLSHPWSPYNTLVVVPAMLYALEQQVQKQGDKVFPKIDLVLIGGQSASPSTLAFCARAFPSARVVQTYACTETASSLTFLEVSRYDTSMQSPPTTTGSNATHNDNNTPVPGGDCVGVPPRHVELGLFLPNSNKGDTTAQTPQITKPFTVGLIGTRGALVMNGYWNRNERPEREQQQPDYCQDWFVTNDLGHWDTEGRLYFCGRADDVIRSGGETILASQVERVLLQHEGISECAVFAEPDPQFGQAVACALVVANGRRLTLTEIRQWCQAQGLAGYKRPRRVFYLNELPKNSSGKILKYRLRERFGSGTIQRSKL